MLLLPTAGVMLLLLVLSTAQQLMFKAWLTGESICWLIKLLLLLALWRTPAATTLRRMLACAAVACWG